MQYNQPNQQFYNQYQYPPAQPMQQPYMDSYMPQNMVPQQQPMDMSYNYYNQNPMMYQQQQPTYYQQQPQMMGNNYYQDPNQMNQNQYPQPCQSNALDMQNQMIQQQYNQLNTQQIMLNSNNNNIPYNQVQQQQPMIQNQYNQDQQYYPAQTQVPQQQPQPQPLPAQEDLSQKLEFLHKQNISHTEQNKQLDHDTAQLQQQLDSLIEKKKQLDSEQINENNNIVNNNKPNSNVLINADEQKQINQQSANPDSSTFSLYPQKQQQDQNNQSCSSTTKRDSIPEINDGNQNDDDSDFAVIDDEEDEVVQQQPQQKQNDNKEVINFANKWVYKYWNAPKVRECLLVPVDENEKNEDMLVYLDLFCFQEYYVENKKRNNNSQINKEMLAKRYYNDYDQDSGDDSEDDERQENKFQLPTYFPASLDSQEFKDIDEGIVSEIQNKFVQKGMLAYILRFFKQERLEKLNLTPKLIEAIMDIIQFVQKEFLGKKGDQNLQNGEYTNKSSQKGVMAYFRALFQTITPRNCKEMSKDRMSEKLHQKLFDIDLNDLSKAFFNRKDYDKQDMIQEVQYVNFLKNCIYELVDKHVKEFILTNEEQERRINEDENGEDEELQDRDHEQDVFIKMDQMVEGFYVQKF